MNCCTEYCSSARITRRLGAALSRRAVVRGYRPTPLEFYPGRQALNSEVQETEQECCVIATTLQKLYCAASDFDYSRRIGGDCAKFRLALAACLRATRRNYLKKLGDS